MNYKIYPLDVGDMELDYSFLSWQTDCGRKDSATTTAWLVLGADKPILIDTSFRSVEDAKKYQGLICQRTAEQTLQAQLKRFQIQPEDVGYIVHTHIHMDHAGQDYLFPNAKIVLQMGELKNAAAPNICPVPFYDRINIARLVNDLWPQIELIEGNVELFPGFHCELLPGHTPYHQIIRLNTTNGEYIIAGDAAMVLENITNQWAPGFLDSMPDTMAGLKKLKPSVDRVLLTHDRSIMQKFFNGIS